MFLTYMELLKISEQEAILMYQYYMSNPRTYKELDEIKKTCFIHHKPRKLLTRDQAIQFFLSLEALKMATYKE